MNRNQIISILVLVALFSSIPLSMARAEDPGTLVTGTIQSINLETDPVTSITTVIVFILDDAGVVHKAKLSLETAISKQLVIPEALIIGQLLTIPDPVDSTIVLTSGIVNELALVTDPLMGITTLDITLTDATEIVQIVNLDLATALTLGLITTNPAMLGTPFEIDAALVIETDTYSQKVTQLTSYFGTPLGLTYDQLAAYEEAGYGFGVIAEACWMAARMGGDAALLDQILTAKSSSDYSAIILPDGSTPTNWGQLRKAVLTDPHQNLGQIVSGKAEPLPAPATVEPVTTTSTDETHGKGKGLGKDHGKSKDK